VERRYDPTRGADVAPSSDLLVVVDDVALPLGRFRLRASGSKRRTQRAQEHRERTTVARVPAAPDRHRAALTTRRRAGSLADFVLDTFDADERAFILARMPTLTDAIEQVVRDGIAAAMNTFNTRDESC